MPGTEQVNKGFLARAHFVFAALGGLYILAIAALSVPAIQSHAIYMNKLKFPFFSKYDAPEKYGLAPGKTINLNITTSDNLTLGAWFIFSHPYYRTIPFPPSAYSDPLSSHLPLALKANPTVLFFHGNAATRAAPYRVGYYQALSTRLSANVLVIDYRGFGDSEGSPSADGLALDARAAWDWLITQGADPADVLIMGHSLGTAVSARLASELAAEGKEFKGLVLMSPFSSITTLVETYMFFKLFPLMKPLSLIPWASAYVAKAIVNDHPTGALIHTIKAPTLFIHALNDWDIPYTHSEALFNTVLDPLLPPIATPPLAASSWPKEQWDAFYSAQSARVKVRAELVRHTEIRNFGTVDAFKQGERKIMLLKTIEGGHNKIGSLEGIHEVIRSTFGFV